MELPKATVYYSLGDKLESLSNIGYPFLNYSKYSNGWSASIDLPSPAGVSIDVRSEVSNTPEAAVDSLLRRLKDNGMFEYE